MKKSFVKIISIVVVIIVLQGQYFGETTVEVPSSPFKPFKTEEDFSKRPISPCKDLTFLLDTIACIGSDLLYTVDLDKDGNQDVISISPHQEYVFTENIIWYQNNGHGDFKAGRVILTIEGYISSLHAADLDNDDDLDLLLSYTPLNHHDVYASLTECYSNDGNQNFKLVFNYVTASEDCVSESAQPTDFDKDGDIDILVSYYPDRLTSAICGVELYENDGKGNFILQQRFISPYGEAKSTYAIDLDKDEDSDIIILYEALSDGSLNKNKEDQYHLIWYENKQNITFSAPKVIATTEDYLSSLQLVDLQGDEILSVLLMNQGKGITVISVQDNEQISEQQIFIDSKDFHDPFYIADLNLDGAADLISVLPLKGKVVWYENLKDGNFGKQQIVMTSGGYHDIISISDLDGDGDLDLLYSNSKILTWYENDCQ